MKKALFFIDEANLDLVYGPETTSEISKRVNLAGERLENSNWRAHLDLLGEVELIMSGWGGNLCLDEELLAATPRLDAVFFGGGSIRGMMTDAAWERGIRVTSGGSANAVAVAEYTLSQILFCLKHGWRLARGSRRLENWARGQCVPGVYRSAVGIVSLGMIGRRVCDLLKPFDLDVLAYDPYLEPTEFEVLNATPMSLEELFARSDVVSLHAPALPQTEGMVTGRLLNSMKPGASFINTARGALVREPELVEVLGRRPDLTAVLDVTNPEPPSPDSPLHDMVNVVITPHIAGAMNMERRRVGQYMLEELCRYLDGRPLQWEISQKASALSA